MAKNTNYVRNKVNSKNYWQDRAEKLYLSGEKDALKVSRHLKNLYNDAIREINEKINSFYGKYASQNGLTLEEAKQLLNKDELKNFKSYIDKMLAMGDKNNFSSNEMYEFKRLYNKAKITRLEELQANIRGELDKLTVQTNSNVADLLGNTYEEGYYNTIYDIQMGEGISKSFTGLNTNAIEKAVNQKYLKSNYSERIWTSTNKLMNTLTNEIPRGLVLGYNPKKLAKEVSKNLDTNYNSTVRLIRTEYSHILTQASLDGFKQAGITQYKILTALDSRRCDDCGEFEGKIININEAEEGIDLPPFHPNCRCTITPYFEEDEIDIMPTEELNKIGFVTYDDWKDGLVELQDNKVQYNWDRGAKIKEDDGYIPVSNLLKNQLINTTNNVITSDKEKAELKYYTSNGYKLFNQPFSKITDYKTKERIALFEDTLNKGTLQQDSILYRGLETFPENLNKLLTNSEAELLKNYQNEPNAKLNSILNKLINTSYIDDETFVSSSIDRDIAINKFGISKDDNIGFLIEIKAKANTKGLYLEKLSVNPEEKEFLINNGYKYLIQNWEIINIDKGKMIKLNVKQIKGGE